MFTILVNFGTRFLPFWLRFAFSCNRLNFHSAKFVRKKIVSLVKFVGCGRLPVEFGCESVVDGEHVTRFNFLGPWILDEDSLRRFAHGQRLQGPDQIAFRNIRLTLNLFVRQFISGIEQHQDAHLIGRHLNYVLPGSSSQC